MILLAASRNDCFYKWLLFLPSVCHLRSPSVIPLLLLVIPASSISHSRAGGNPGRLSGRQDLLECHSRFFSISHSRFSYSSFPRRRESRPSQWAPRPPGTSFPRRRESSQTKSLYKSLQCGFLSSINLSFHARFHFLICFSRVIATYISACNSK